MLQNFVTLSQHRQVCKWQCVDTAGGSGNHC